MDRPKINWQKYKQPLTVEVHDWYEGNEEYLYDEQLKKIGDLLKEFKAEKHSSKFDSQKSLSVKNIAVTGDRGTGKSSFISSITKLMVQQDYYVFEPITSSLLETGIRIFEVVLAQIYTYIIDSESTDVLAKTTLQGKIKRIIKALELEKTVNKQDYVPSVEKLSQLKDRTNLDQLFQELLEDFRRFLGANNQKKYEDFVLVLDDLDLTVNGEMINDIQRYLSGHLIIIFGYNEELILNSLVNEKLSELELSIKHGQMKTKEVTRLCENILFKLIPKPNRIYLLDQYELLSRKINKVLPKELIGSSADFTCFSKEDNDQSVEEWLYDFIYRHTNLKIAPVDTKEDTKYFLPKTLRDFIQSCELFYDMKSINTKPIDDDTSKNSQNNRNQSEADLNEKRLLPSQSMFKNLQYNLDQLERYFDLIPKTFEEDDQEYLEQWKKATSYKKNYLTFHHFYNKLDDAYSEDFKQLKLERLKFVEDYNLTLGNVYSVMETTKRYSDLSTQDYSFIYFVKVMYSIELSRLLYKGKPEDKLEGKVDESPYLERYLQLINASFMPETMNYFGYTKWYDEEDYRFTYSKKQGEFIKDYMNSDVAASGDVRKVIYSGASSFSYRPLYTFDDIELTDTRKYYFTFFARPAKRDYIEVFYKESSNNLSPYVFFNMFHIDVFVRQLYSRRTNFNKDGENIEIEFVLTRINQILNKNANKPEYNFITGTKREQLETLFSVDGDYKELYQDEEKNGRILQCLREDIPLKEFNQNKDTINGRITQKMALEELKNYNSKVPDGYRYSAKDITKGAINDFVGKVLLNLKHAKHIDQIREYNNRIQSSPKLITDPLRQFQNILDLIVEDVQDE